MLKLQRDFNCKKSEPETQKSFSVDLSVENISSLWYAK